MQKRWQSFSGPQRIIKRTMLRDTDRDGVPDRYDCQPLNPLKQDMIVTTPYGDRYRVNKKGEITQASNKDFSGQWKMQGLQHTKRSEFIPFKDLTPEKVAKQMLDRFEILLKDNAQPAARRKI